MGEMQETMTVMLTTGHGSEPEPVEVPLRVGNVKLGRMLGEGAGGAVFLGFDALLNRPVAVKVLHARRGAEHDAGNIELVEGVRSAAAIRHPNVVTIYDVETVNGMPVIVMEYVDGVSMRDVLASLGRAGEPLGEFIMRSVVAAVAVLHDANVVHRDLKPANILFDSDGHAHVCDFGLACGFDLRRMQSSTTTIGGSPLYMAPETFDGHVSPASDVYSLGVMLFEVLAGRPPFQASSLSDIQRQHGAAQPPMELLEAASVSPGACEIVQRCLHKQRYLRFKTAAHLLRAMEERRTAREAEDGLRLRLAQTINAQRGGPAARPAAATATPAATTFDLIAERARAKRQSRGE